jgi:hypothetical protein
MTKEEIVEHFDIEDPVIFFEPSEVFNKGILGISEDKHHLIYGYYTLAAALAEDYEKEWKGKEHKEDEEEPDFMSDAFEWLDYNTIRSLPYCDEDVCPILIYELPQE